MKQQVLVKFKDEWNGATLEGCAVYYEVHWNNLVLSARQWFKDYPMNSLRWYFTPNDSISWDTMEQFRQTFEVTQIDDITAVVIKRNLLSNNGEGHFGLFPDFDFNPPEGWHDNPYEDHED